MIASQEPWQLITTFNEWGEGTSVELASEWSRDYLDEEISVNGTRRRHGPILVAGT
jgi:hypothetical protein